MKAFVDIQPGQWVLAFSQPYAPLEGALKEHIETFTSRGGGWDSHSPDDIFMVLRVSSVSPKTYLAPLPARWRYGREEADKRHDRGSVIAAGQSEKAMLALRDKFYAIGATTDNIIDAETERRMTKFREREYGKATKQIRRMFPHFFGGEA